MDWVWKEDHWIFWQINVGLHSPILDPISTILSYSGLGISIILFALSLVFWDGTRRLVIPILATELLSGAIISDALFKAHLARDRPSNLLYAIPEEAHRLGSFPSGHSCVSFGTACTILFLLWRTPGQRWGWVALVWAILVGLSRIYRGVHWPTDVLAGACVGLFSACVVVGLTQVVTGGGSTKSKRSRGSTSESGKRRKPSSGGSTRGRSTTKRR
jgi:undecaprenyl-diphosphatase